MQKLKHNEEPIHKVQIFDIGTWQPINLIEFSPYEWSKDLLFIISDKEIRIASVTFREERDEDEENEFKFEIIFKMVWPCDIQSVAWGPDTSLKGLPQILSFAIADYDHKISYISRDFKEEKTCIEFKGHKSFINEISFDPDGNYIASVSDDLTCKLWNIQNSPANTFTSDNYYSSFGDISMNKSTKDPWEMSFKLLSPGMSVCWHPADPNKILVAEKNGLIQLFQIDSLQSLLSVDAGHTPLISAHWAPANNRCVAVLSAGELTIWDLDKMSRPSEVRPLHTQGGKKVRFSNNSENIVATLGRPCNEFKIINTKSKLPIISLSVPLASGISWHQHLPYVCVGIDNFIHFWKVSTK